MVALATLLLTPEALNVATSVQVGAAAVPPDVAEMLATYLPVDTTEASIAQVTDCAMASTVGTLRPPNKSSPSLACAFAV